MSPLASLGPMGRNHRPCCTDARTATMSGTPPLSPRAARTQRTAHIGPLHASRHRMLKESTTRPFGVAPLLAFVALVGCAPDSDADADAASEIEAALVACPAGAKLALTLDHATPATVQLASQYRGITVFVDGRSEQLAARLVQLGADVQAHGTRHLCDIAGRKDASNAAAADLAARNAGRPLPPNGLFADISQNVDMLRRVGATPIAFAAPCGNNDIYAPYMAGFRFQYSRGTRSGGFSKLNTPVLAIRRDLTPAMAAEVAVQTVRDGIAANRSFTYFSHDPDAHERAVLSALEAEANANPKVTRMKYATAMACSGRAN